MMIQNIQEPQTPSQPPSTLSARTKDRLVAAVVAMVAIGSLTLDITQPASAQMASSARTASREPKPLAGLVIALDPGHQLGNSNPRFHRQLAQRRFQGRVWKSCNTTGTATNSGYPEATFNFEVARLLRTKLLALGAEVPMTRTTNDRNHWGPCTWDRGTFGVRNHAELLLSIHADGAPSSGRGFHIITPALTKGWTDHIYRRDRSLAEAMKRGMLTDGGEPSTYIHGAISVRGDMMSLNYSKIPSVLVELGNMRNRYDAARMTSLAGREKYAGWLLTGIRTYLNR